MNDLKKILISVAVIVVLLSLVVVIMVYQKPNELGEISEEKVGNFSNNDRFEKINIKEYSSVVSAEKPAQIMLKFAESSSKEKEGTELTVYNQNMALVKEMRALNLKNGLNLVQYEDIASQIKADTVLFTDLSDPNAIVIEQNYEYDLVSLDKILKKYLGKTITVTAKDGNSYTGKLLSYRGSVVLETEGKIISISEVSRYEFPELPEGLLTKPTLVWKLYTEKEGIHNTQTSYITNGVNWSTSYVAKVSADDKFADLTGWVTIYNNSGTSYPNTSLKLVAGELNIAQQEYVVKRYEYAETKPTSGPQFTEEAFFEYHLYTLDRKTDIKDNETKQINLLEAEKIALKKEYIFDEQQDYYYYSSYYNTSKGKVKTMVSFENSKSNNIGMPLPKGIVRVYKEDSQGKLQFVGEDSIYHTPKDEKVRLFLGYAFDIVAEKKVLETTNVGDRCTRKSYEVSIRNRKDEDIIVTSIQKNYYASNDLLTSSHKGNKKDAYTYEFDVPVKANSETKLTYTIMSCW
ncbi:MAG: DUF4139 domain-containing protein [Candidatus Diapherotrites archaeon]|nr:DUF4139 domain-containing protein [Candidatus Diapherotrites archaeon]